MTNAIYFLNKADDIFADCNKVNYKVESPEEIIKDIPGFENIPLDDIGRVIR